MENEKEKTLIDMDGATVRWTTTLPEISPQDRVKNDDVMNKMKEADSFEDILSSVMDGKQSGNRFAGKPDKTPEKNVGFHDEI